MLSAARNSNANICQISADESETLTMPTCRTFTVYAAAFAMTWLVLCLVVAAPSPASAGPRKTAVFPFEFVDDSQANEMFPKVPPEEAARLKMIHDRLTELLAATGDYAPTDTAPAAESITKARNFRDCRDCAEEIGRSLGAEVVVVSWVQKVSNLILNINISISDAKTGTVLAQGYADIRGNTDETWRRGLEWIVRNRLIHNKEQ